MAVKKLLTRTVKNPFLSSRTIARYRRKSQEEIEKTERSTVTMSEWERDGRHAPDYLVRLLEYYIRVEMLKQKGPVSDPDAERTTENGGNNHA